MPRRLIVEIVGNAAGFESAMTRAGVATEGFGSKLGGLAKMAALAIGAGAVGGIALVLDKSVKAALAGQASQAQLNAALKSTHQSVLKMTPALNAAEAASRKLGFADDQSRVALAKLEVATGSTAKATADLSVAADIARFKHTDLTTASQMLAMAMTGSQRAVKQLGINVSAVTTNLDALKASHENLKTAIGKTDEAHAKLMDKMATGNAIIATVSEKLHGQADAFASTAAGGMEQFHAQLTHVEEMLGNKLLPTMSRVLDWVNTHWPQISAVVTTVASAIGRAITFVKPYIDQLIDWTSQLVAYVQSHWAEISAYVSKAMVTIRSIITQVVTAAKAIWAQFGSAITSIAHTAFAATIAVIRDSFNVVVGIFQLIGDLIHGRWGKVWDDLKKIVSNATSAIVTIIESMVTIAYTAALAVGKAIVGGVLDGLKSLASSVGGAIHSGISSAVSFAGNLLHGSGPFQFTNEAIGVPLGQGIVDGFLSTTNTLANAMTATIAKAVAATKAIIATAQSTFSTEFQGFQTIADQMFSGVAGAAQTTAGKLLAKLTEAHNAAQLAQQVTAARTGLTTAQAGVGGVVDPAAVLAAQQALNDALYQQHIANLTKIAAAEQIDLTARNQVKQIAFDNALKALEEHLKKTGASTDVAMADIQKLLGKYGVSFAAVGADMGDAWVGGLSAAIRRAAEGSSLLKRVIGEQALTLGGALGGVPHAATGGYVSQTGLAVIHQGETVVPAGRGGGGVTNYFSFPSYVGSRQDLQDMITGALVKANRRGGLLTGDLA